MQGQFMGTYYNFTTTQISVAAFVFLVVVGIGLATYVERRKTRTRTLRDRFGSEYDRAVIAHGSSRRAEAKLDDRQTRVNAFEIRELGLAERERLVTEWHTVQARFVDHPKSAVNEADELINTLLDTRGYPHASFEQRAADVSVTYPRVMENYRLAHGIAVRTGRTEATTEELRTAMIQYRDIFDELAQAQRPAEAKSAA